MPCAIMPAGSSPEHEVRSLVATAFALVMLAASGQTMATSLVLDGEPKQGALVVGETEAGAEVRLDGDAVRVSPDGHFVIGFERDAPARQSLEIVLPNGKYIERTLEIDQREYDIQHVDGVPPETVNPPEEALPRIEREARLIREARRRDEPRTDFLGDFRWPAQGRISGVYGSQRVYNGEPRRPHFGVDIANSTGTPIRAPAAGVVTLAERDMYFNGTLVMLDHGHGVASILMHMSALHVEQGDRVEQGELIGEIGATGRVTGPHLHWEMNWLGRRLDPMLLVDGTPAE